MGRHSVSLLQHMSDEDPDKVLIAAIILQAYADAMKAPWPTISPSQYKQIHEAREFFLDGPALLMLCEWLGLDGDAVRQQVTAVLEEQEG